MSALEMERVRVEFDAPGGPVRALRGLDLNLTEGEFVAVIGANGAGKSTLVNVIAGSTSVTDGRVRLAGKDLRRVTEHRRAHEIARVFQDTSASVCSELTVRENLMLAATRRRRRSPFRPARDKRRIAEAAASLDRYGSALASRLDSPAGLLSGGQRQLVALTMAVLAKPSVLLLDEHTSALDPKMAETVMEATREMVAEEGLTTLMITHHLGHAARYGDRLIIMSAGNIVDELTAADPARRDEAALIDRFRASTAGALSDSMLA